MIPYTVRKFTDALNDRSELYYSTLLALEHDTLALESLCHALERDNEEFALSLWVSLQRPFVARKIKDFFAVVELDSETQSSIDDWRETHQYGIFQHDGKSFEGYCRIHYHGYSSDIGFESLLYGKEI